MKKTIAIDLDSTLNNLDEVWMARYNADWNDNKTVLDMTDWDTSKIVKPECGVKIFDYFKEDGFFANLGIRRGARAVTEWLAENYDLYIVTAYSYHTCKDKGIWVQRNLPSFNIKNLVFLNDKFMFNADYLIDDAAHNAEKFPNKVLLFDSPCPWNWCLEDQFQRVKGWHEVYDFFYRELESEE